MEYLSGYKRRNMALTKGLRFSFNHF